MDSRERTIRAIERRSPDRVPAYYSILAGAMHRSMTELNGLWQRYPQDIVKFGYPATEEFSGEVDVPATDRWGAVWTSAFWGHKGQVTVHPLSDWSAMADYPWPNSLGWVEFDYARAVIEQDQGEHYALADGDTLFQRMAYLRGMEPLFIDLATGRREAFELRDRICEYMLARIDRWIELGVDGIYFRDDWGSQETLLINPKLWRSFFKPAYAKLCDRAHDGGLHVFFHSDGMIASILPDFVEIGVDVLHPQMQLLDARFLADNYGGKISFQCDPDRQAVLPRGTPQDVEHHVQTILETLAPFGGGVIGWGEIGPDVPLQNTEAMVRSFFRWRYD